MNATIPISDLRRRFGEIEALLPHVEHITITKKGKPFALLTATNEVKKSIIAKCAGVFKDTDLDDNLIWEEALRKKSRKKPTSI